MPVRTGPEQYIDDDARATRVITVSGTGSAGTQRTTTITRFASAGPAGVTPPGTRNITAGKRSWSIAVLTASSTASPTLDGVALPSGTSVEMVAPSGDTLESAVLVTAAGDDVVLTEVA